MAVTCGGSPRTCLAQRRARAPPGGIWRHGQPKPAIVTISWHNESRVFMARMAAGGEQRRGGRPGAGVRPGGLRLCLSAASLSHPPWPAGPSALAGKPRSEEPPCRGAGGPGGASLSYPEAGPGCRLAWARGPFRPGSPAALAPGSLPGSGPLPRAPPGRPARFPRGSDMLRRGEHRPPTEVLSGASVS
ncbi:SWI/SNF-related matrix-associated actin-dependent regulator of chromatin subfamily D member 2-like [Leopardus geoffroyi]|uniref:SWI/SNF-related matrix-associated actin-dependent regulator of chromatin subfamily D member 2-like n=1 Tax=Leopardus geoffroyi TaxID=46844 RepID=UPI001E260C3D|nr:SWI/SNF-related matrix-associated actin-dependent regulator of chromatin subfamily D member 2-like [Leopardus geoffroyi]